MGVITETVEYWCGDRMCVKCLEQCLADGKLLLLILKNGVNFRK